ncbi:hypothetical protein CKF54_05425 [Psittacicella hinzii]|uniref:Uncharacterized protein n=1 Tax=Psittacicella hinzii TaxID=2028575 RepID=A0A3A1Y172_9GAMM|nr:hypothetical protein [Psittacicella hinzii]RIY32092.1 hypothetical protein CKF54_05425 [Psittacicella hinzii]
MDILVEVIINNLKTQVQSYFRQKDSPWERILYDFKWLFNIQRINSNPIFMLRPDTISHLEFVYFVGKFVNYNFPSEFREGKYHYPIEKIETLVDIAKSCKTIVTSGVDLSNDEFRELYYLYYFISVVFGNSKDQILTCALIAETATIRNSLMDNPVMYTKFLQSDDARINLHLEIMEKENAMTVGDGVILCCGDKVNFMLDITYLNKLYIEENIDDKFKGYVSNVFYRAFICD